MNDSHEKQKHLTTAQATEEWIRHLAWIGQHDDPCKVAIEAAGLMRTLLDEREELLAVCKMALGAFERNDAIDWSELERAIAKAEGAPVERTER